MTKPSILAANSLICKPKERLLTDPNYFLRKDRTFRVRLMVCRGLYKLQKLIMEGL